MNRYTQTGRIVRIVLCGAVVLGVLGVMPLAMAAEVQVQRLDDPGRDPVNVTELIQWELTPDKEQVVFAGDFGLDGVYGLYSAPACAEGEPVLLSTTPGASVRQFCLTPNSAQVAYIDQDGKVSTVPVDGTAAPSVLALADADYRVQCTDNWVVYFSFLNIYAVPISGGALPESLLAGSPDQISHVRLSPDGETVIYRARYGNEERLLSVAIDGQGEPAELFSTQQNLYSEIVISPNSQRIVFAAGEQDGKTLYSVEPGNPASLVTLVPLAPLSSSFYSWTVTPDSARVVFLQRNEEGEYYTRSVPIEGSTPAAEVSKGSYLAIHPDSTMLVLLRDVALSSTEKSYGLYAAATDGGSEPILLSQDDDVVVAGVSHDCSRVAYINAQGTLRVAATDNTQPPIDVCPIAYEDAPNIFFTGENSHIVLDGGSVISIVAAAPASLPAAVDYGNGQFLGLGAGDTCAIVKTSSSIDAIPFATGGRFLISPPALTAPKYITQYESASDGESVFFTNRINQYDRPMFKVPVDGSAYETMISESYSINHFWVAQEPSVILFETLLTAGFRSVPEDLSTPSQAFPYLFSMKMTLDGQRVLSHEEDGFGSTQLKTMLVADPQPVTIYDGARTDNEFFTQDGNSVILLRSDGTLLVAPSEGGAPPLQISGAEFVRTVPGVSLNSTWAAYLATARVYSIYSPMSTATLYTAPLDGHIAPEALAENVTVGRHAFTYNGNWLVYSARRAMESAAKAEAIYDLYAATSDGTVGPLLLAEGVADFEIHPTKEQVVYTTDMGELFVANVSGTRTDVLSDTEPVAAFQLNPAGTWVVYMADVGGVARLFARPFGKPAATLINPIPLCEGLPATATLAPFAGWLPFQISKDGKWVTYRAHDDGVYALYATPLGGGVIHILSADNTQPDGTGLWAGDYVVYRDIVAGPLGGGLYSARVTGSPVAAIAPAPGQPDTTATLPALFDVVFDMPVTGLDAEDFVNTGTAQGVTFMVVEITPNRYMAAAESSTSGGTIIPSLPAGSVFNDDDDGNNLSIAEKGVTLTGSVAVPSLAGVTQDNLAAALAAAGLVLGEVTQEYSATIPAGQVIRQEPSADAVVAPGTAIHVWISAGVAPVAVPNVAGMTQTAAEAAIVAAGLAVGNVVEEYSATVPAGQVTRQTPEADALVAPGSAVNIWVSSGEPYVFVPDVVGMTQEAAEAALTQVGLTLGVVTQVFSETVPAGVVISQNPGAGSAMPAGGAVALTVSKGVAVATGSLQVTILPQAAIDAGAQWRVDGGAWRASGAIVTELTPGAHVVEFSDTGGDGAIGCVNEACTCFITPEAMNADIAAGETAVVTATYENKGTADDAGIAAVILTILLLLFHSRKGRKPEDEA